MCGAVHSRKTFCLTKNLGQLHTSVERADSADSGRRLRTMTATCVCVCVCRVCVHRISHNIRFVAFAFVLGRRSSVPFLRHWSRPSPASLSWLACVYKRVYRMCMQTHMCVRAFQLCRREFARTLFEEVVCVCACVCKCTRAGALLFEQVLSFERSVLYVSSHGAQHQRSQAHALSHTYSSCAH